MRKANHSWCCCLVYWALRGLAKIIYNQNKNTLFVMHDTTVNLSLVLLYSNILGLIVGFYITTYVMFGSIAFPLLEPISFTFTVSLNSNWQQISWQVLHWNS